jgi:queuine tRNA-ribosyltransferase
MLPALEAATTALPLDRPRYLMGVGDPVGLVEGIARGVDMFDCVLPTRRPRHPTVLPTTGRSQLRNASNARSDAPLDAACACAVCARWSRAYLRHLFQVNEPTGPRLVTIHNLSWTLQLMRRIRAAIAAGTFAAVRDEVLGVWT